MATEMEGPAPAGAPDATPDDALAAIRAELAAGQPLVGALASRFYRAVHALDPAATEESLAPLPGNRGVQLYDSLISWASLTAGDQVLDLGCGSGGAARVAARVVGEDGMVIGIDISPECVAEATARTPADLPVMFRRGDIARLGAMPDRTFSCVIASMVLDQIDDLAPVLAECFRVLRPGGRMVASVMSFDHLRPMDASFMGSVIAVVGRHSPGGLAGRASRASIPHEPRDLRAFKDAGLATVEELDVQLAAVMEDPDDAWALFSRSYIVHMLGEEGREDLRRVLRRRMPHTLYLPVRFLRTRRPG